MKTLYEFLSSGRTFDNAWLQYGEMEVYVRRGLHMLNGEPTSTFDIANVSLEEEHRGQGTFKRFLSEVVKLLQDPVLRGGIKAIYLENVLTPRLIETYTRWGFIEIPSQYTGPPCFYRAL